MNEPNWKVERQPSWLVAAIRRTIADLPRGYEETAEILGIYKSDNVTLATDPIHNRLRAGGDQIFPMNWALVLQAAGGTHHVANAIAHASGGVFVPVEEVENVDNGDINQRLLEAIEQISAYSQVIRTAIQDGVVDPRERVVIDEDLYQVIAKLHEHASLVFRVFCAPENSDAREHAHSGRRGKS